MRLSELSRDIAARFDCTCSLSAHREGGRSVLRVRYDTARLPRSWEAFVRADDAAREAIEVFVRTRCAVDGYDRIEVEHRARSPRTAWLPVGTDGVIAVPAAPDYFRRTGQEAVYSPDRHGGDTFKL
jgi:hypothetical protein